VRREGETVGIPLCLVRGHSHEDRITLVMRSMAATMAVTTVSAGGNSTGMSLEGVDNIIPQRTNLGKDPSFVAFDPFIANQSKYKRAREGGAE
jgi:hypothetical protein